MAEPQHRLRSAFRRLLTTAVPVHFAGSLALVTTLAVFATATVAQTPELEPRLTPTKPAQTTLTAEVSAHRLVLKFNEGTRVRLRNGRLVGAVDPRDVRDVLAAHGIAEGAIKRLHTRSEDELDRLRAKGQRKSGRELADLNLYYVIDLPAGADAAVIADHLNALDEVEFAEPAPLPTPPPVDIPPPTPDLTPDQGYLQSAPAGIGALDAAIFFPGSDGQSSTIVDVEYNWVLDHEDLELPSSANIDSATLVDPFPSDQANHGTAVLGIIGGGDNGYGVIGIASRSTIEVAPALTLEFGYNVARAITNAAAVIGPGDVILIEQQAGVCGGTCGASQIGCGPVEWRQADFDAIAAATAIGIVVVEAAGNGNVNLDAAACEGRFDRLVRDSGAIVVGAGGSSTRARLSFSSFGSRVDVQGWGDNVTSTGYGDAFDPGDIKQRYTNSFGGTSSASAVVAGAVLAIQGALTASGQAPADPAAIRQALVDTGTRQLNPDEQIGPLPNITAALDQLLETGLLALAFDIKPGSCPNSVSSKAKGVLPAAILGSATFDAKSVDPATVRLEGTAPLRWSVADVATPVDPLEDEVDATDCTRQGADGHSDLALKFDNQAVLQAIGPVSKNDVLVLEVTGKLKDGTALRGEDVVVVVR
jgi:hypothetical protein